jgi:predicted nucleotidyltransferase
LCKSKNCNLLGGLSRELIGCNFLLSCETLKPNKNKRQAIPASLCATEKDFCYICTMTQFESIFTTIQQLKPELTRKFGVSSIGLFGSIVRNDFSPGKSDIDIIVDFSKPIGIEFIDLADFLESTFKRKVDLVSKNGIKNKYFREIEKEIVYV